MKLLPTFKTERYRKAHKNRQRYRLALICLAVLVASATGYALIHPAITMTAAAHRHDASCYTQVTFSLEQALHCTFAQEHADDTACIVHLHDQTCYDDTGALVCTLVEVEAHTHTEACHTVPEAHTHSEDCYERQQGDLRGRRNGGTPAHGQLLCLGRYTRLRLGRICTRRACPDL